MDIMITGSIYIQKEFRNAIKALRSYKIISKAEESGEILVEEEDDTIVISFLDPVDYAGDLEENLENDLISLLPYNAEINIFITSHDGGHYAKQYFTQDGKLYFD